MMNILVGYDGSNACKEALKVAIAHAKAFGGRIHLVASMAKGTADEHLEIKDMEDQLDENKRLVEKSSVQCETHLLIRGLMPGEDLVEYAKEKDVEEIVMGIRRRSKVGKLLFGSTAQYVILNAPCPVVTVK
ncbi:MAG: universal stress protein [Desulfosarcinaceae bacterium]